MIDHQPTFSGFNRRRTKADLVRIPPPAPSCFKNDLVASPMPQIRRVGYPHMSAQRRHGAMNQRPSSAYPARQHRRIFILGRHDNAISLKVLKIPGKRERDAGTSSCKGCISHGVLLKFRDIGNARIFDTPYLLGIFPGICHQCRLRINAPSIDTVDRTRGTKMRQSAAIFNAAEQQRVAVGQPYSPRVKDAVNRIGPVFPAENRIAGIARKQGIIVTWF